MERETFLAISRQLIAISSQQYKGFSYLHQLAVSVSSRVLFAIIVISSDFISEAKLKLYREICSQ